MQKPVSYFIFRFTLHIITVLLVMQANAFQKSYRQTDSIPYNKKMVRSIAMVETGVYAGSMFGLYHSWYKNYPQSSFHLFNDMPEWQQMDKLGHVYSAYSMGRYGMELWKQTGISRKKYIWWGGMLGAIHQTSIELLDAYSAEWGWSWGDVGANFLGSGLLIGQELAWNEQRIQMKLSFHNKRYDDADLNARSNLLFGKSTAERTLKDYNGQTYWLSANVHSFFPKSKFPSWLNISVGTGIENTFGARSNVATTQTGNIPFDRSDLPRYRQWYLAPDIDFTRIPTKHKGVRALLFILNSVKFPTPAIEFSQNKFHWHWFYF